MNYMANDIGSDRVRFYLVVWKGWMMSHDNGLGYPKKAAMCTGAGKRQFDGSNAKPFLSEGRPIVQTHPLEKSFNPERLFSHRQFAHFHL